MKKFVWAMVAAMAVGMMACGGKAAGGGDSDGSAEADGTAGALMAPVAAEADSLLGFVESQVAFGPRTPGSDSHARCRRYLAETMRRYGVDTVMEQQALVSTWKGETLTAHNILARINPGATSRVLLLAHYDTRPWADEDPSEEYRDTPIDGANDGASGVGVILEIARALKGQADGPGVDILFVDGEDYGPHADGGGDDGDCWALGTQYWLAEPTLDLGAVRAAILLDMVGGRDARFHKEYFSNLYAREVVDKVWKAAKAAGYGDRFDSAVGGAITDDHVYFLREGVAAIDIIESANPTTGSFNPTWHTLDDNISNIDRATLGAVGETVIRALRDI